MELLKRLIREDEGVTAIEYGLIAALIAVMLIVGATAVGTAVNGTFLNVAGQMTP